MKFSITSSHHPSPVHLTAPVFIKRRPRQAQGSSFDVQDSHRWNKTSVLFRQKGQEPNTKISRKSLPDFSILLAPKTSKDSLAKTVSFPTQITLSMQDYALGIFIYWLGRRHECGGLCVALLESTGMEVIQVKQFISKNLSRPEKY